MTIKEHLEAIQRMLSDEWDYENERLTILEHAVAALNDLKDAQHQYQCVNRCVDCVRPEPIRSTDIRIALIPDSEEAS